MSAVTAYWDLPNLSEIYLEDSWVLDVVAEPAVLRFKMELVLREGHPSYHPPKPGEQYCYLPGRLIFRQATSLSWEGPSVRPAVDATGEKEYGSVDEFRVEAGGYRLIGDFGDIHVTSAASEVSLDTARK